MICLWSIGVAPVRGGHLLSLHAAKKVGKENGFKPLILKRVPWLGGDSGAINERSLAQQTAVTRLSFAPTPHCVRRGQVCKGNQRLFLCAVGSLRLRLGEAQTTPVV
ncbi:hypothetical protein BN2475_1080027 [Paraburkholderia ribeironis]|uniref:Uncharacterized protein n=1 Tax=Paraburkholderia ribeironis TaxID=1247936 RepID=A0A1N7SN32_9BURK|nr:hypothetical protein BN2475_1080027 [Paraburkholderia ribeironis]